VNSIAAGIVNVVGRVLLTGIFLMSAFANKIPNFEQTVSTMKAEGVPIPNIMLAGAIAFLVAGGLMVLLGFRTRVGATLLLIFLILATYYFHDFWTMSGSEKQTEMINFMKNSSLMGAMLILISRGSGPWSLDYFFAKKKPADGA
jgi:putative oxidoreductase